MPIRDRDRVYGAVISTVVRMFDEFNLAAEAPLAPFGIGLVGPAVTPEALLDRSLSVKGGAEAASVALWENPTELGTMRVDRTGSSGFGLTVGLDTAAVADGASPYAAAPADPAVDVYVASRALVSSRQRVTARIKPPIPLGAATSWDALLVARFDPEELVGYYLAVRTYMDGINLMGSYEVGEILAGSRSPLAAAVEFQATNPPSLVAGLLSFTISLEVVPDGGSGTDLIVRGHDYAGGAIADTVNDAAAAHASLLTGRRVGLGVSAPAGATLPAYFLRWSGEDF